MKTLNLIAGLTAMTLAAVAAPASAQWFVGAGLGQSQTDDSTVTGFFGATPFTLTSTDSSQTSLQVYGGYQFTPIWGVQVQYTTLGKRNGIVTLGAPINGIGTTSDTRAYQWGVAGTGTFFLTDKWFARGKLGISSNHVEDTSAFVVGTGGAVAFTVSSSDNTDVLAGIGVGYKWSDHFQTRLEYEYFGKFDIGNNSDVKGSNIGLRMQYSF